MASPMTEQLELVTMKPPDCLRQRLELDELEVIGIDLRNDKRHLWVHAEGRRVGDHGTAGVGKGRLHLARDDRRRARQR